MFDSQNDSPNVLLIDDDTSLLRSMARALSEFGLDVETTTCTAEARAILNRYDVDAVVCDQQMPGQTGLEFLTDLLKESPDLITFMLTGQVSGVRMAQDWAKEIGVYQVFSKPCNSEELANAIKAATAAKSHP